MFLDVQCGCGKEFRVKDELAGKRVRCPTCGEPIRVESRSGQAVRARKPPAEPVLPRLRAPLGVPGETDGTAAAADPTPESDRPVKAKSKGKKKRKKKKKGGSNEREERIVRLILGAGAGLLAMGALAVVLVVHHFYAGFQANKALLEKYGSVFMKNPALADFRSSDRKDPTIRGRVLVLERDFSSGHFNGSRATGPVRLSPIQRKLGEALQARPADPIVTVFVATHSVNFATGYIRITCPCGQAIHVKSNVGLARCPECKKYLHIEGISAPAEVIVDDEKIIPIEVKSEGSAHDGSFGERTSDVKVYHFERGKYKEAGGKRFQTEAPPVKRPFQPAPTTLRPIQKWIESLRRE